MIFYDLPCVPTIRVGDLPPQTRIAKKFNFNGQHLEALSSIIKQVGAYLYSGLKKLFAKKK